MRPGDSMLHYTIGELIGVGGMGEVRQATDSRLGREVAIKLLPEDLARDVDRRQRFEREARTLASLQHPNIATIHGLEEADGRLFLVMELVGGEDLKERLDGRRLRLEDALDIATQIAEGLEEAHAQGIVHRDLKPANVKLTPEGRVKILDFGLACVMQDDPTSGTDSSDSPTLTVGMTREGAILGTAAYMSPEQARGKAVDARTDIWALGCILFEMLSGQNLFAGDTLSDTLASVLKTEPDWSLLPQDLPRAVRRLLQRCLAKNPRDRYHSVADVRIELSAATTEPEAAADGLPTPRAGRGRRAYPWLVAGLVLTTLAAILWPRGEITETPPPRLEALTFSTRDWSPDISPDGAMIAFVSDRDGRSRIWLKQIAGGGEARLTDGPDDNPRYSPDGAQVLFVRDDISTRHLYRTSVVGGQLRMVVDNSVEGDWSPDGDSVAFLRTDPVEGNNIVKVGVVEVQSGRERILLEIHDRLCYGIRWSPDGTTVVVNETSLTGNVAEASCITLIDAQSGESRRIIPTGRMGPFTVVDWLPDSSGFMFGQSTDVIAHVSGRQSQMLTYHFDDESTWNHFWGPMRVPQGGWGATTVAILNDSEVVFDEQTLYAELLLYDLENGAEAQPQVLTRSLGIDRQPAFSPDESKLVFSSNRSGNVDLWVRDQMTGELAQLTDDPAGDWDPAFSPDGQSILWSSNRTGHMEVWMAALDGSQSRRVSDDGVDAENPTMTADGEWIVYASSNDEKRGIWKVRTDGTDAQLLASGAYLLPEVSPDGRYVAFISIRNLDYVLYVLEFETGRILPYEVELVVTGRGQNVVLGRARWAADGRSLYYVGQDAEGLSGIYRLGFDPEGIPDESPRQVAGFDPIFTTESLGVSASGRYLVTSALHEQRVLRLVSGLDLGPRR